MLLLNNGGWGIFRPVADRKDLLDLPPWPYAELGRAVGRLGRRASRPSPSCATRSREAGARETFAIVEAIIDPDDHSPVARKYIGASLRQRAARLDDRLPLRQDRRALRRCRRWRTCSAAAAARGGEIAALSIETAVRPAREWQSVERLYVLPFDVPPQPAGVAAASLRRCCCARSFRAPS